MFDKDFWDEVLESITRQKWRSIMTAFGVFWGMFMLVILIGAGMGLNNGIIGSYTNLPTNTLFITAKETTKPYAGMESGRSWQIKNHDLHVLSNEFSKDIKDLSFLVFSSIGGGSLTIWQDASGTYDMAGIAPNFIKAAPHRLLAGRYINQTDIDERRNVCVVGAQMQETLFGGADPIRQDIRVNDKVFTIVGVCKSTNDKINFGVDLSNSILIPYTIAQTLFAKPEQVDLLLTILQDETNAEELQPQVTARLKALHQIHPEDEEAIDVFNLKQFMTQINALFVGVNMLIWLVGLGTLLAGLIGISNIMMVTVKERTQEIGVRRALGAPPFTIIKQIMCESLVLTAIAGFGGLCVGLWILQMIRTAVGTAEGGSFSNPYIPFGTAIACLLILIIGGLFAGFVPAKRAMAIKAIEALREE